MSNVAEKSCRGNQNPHFMFDRRLFENLAVFQITLNNYSRTGHRWQYGAKALHTGHQKLQTQTQSM
jgi:hypothetical protein